MSLNWRHNVRGQVSEFVARVLDTIQQNLASVQTDVERLKTAVAAGGPSLSSIRSALQAGGSAPLNVEGLLGRLSQAQIGGAPSFSSLPTTADPASKDGALISLTGSPATLYRFNGASDPGTWVQVVTAGLLNILKGGVAVGTEQGLNFIEGSNITLTVADNPGASRVDVTIATAAAAWTTWSPTWTNLTVGNGTVTAKYYQSGKFVVCRLTLVMGTTTSVTGEVSVSLPVTSVAYAGTAGTQPLGLGGAYDTSATAATQILPVWGSTTTADLDVDATTPYTWATGDEINFQLYYEAA